MKNSYVIGIDIGTQGTKTVVFSIDGKKAGEAFEPSRLIHGGAGQVYQEPSDIYESVLRTVKEAMEKSGVEKGRVEALGIDAQMAGIMGIDRDFEAVGVYDSWLDTGCEPYIRRMKETAGREIVRKTGGAVTYAHGPKILHRKEQKPGEYARIVRFVLPGVYAAGKMCGLKAEQAWTDYTHLHFSGFADNEKKRWDDGLLQEFGVDKEKMPAIVSPFQVMGTLTREAAAACGLKEGVRVVAGCGDSAASALGAGIVRKDMVYDVAGTAAIFSCSTERYTPDEKNQALMFARSVIDGLYTPLAYIGGGGLCLKWFRDRNGKSYDYWNEEAGKSEPGSGNLYFVPHFSGRTCPNDPGVKGAWWGLSFYHTSGHMYRSIMESLAYEYAYYFSVLKEQNPQIAPDCIYGAGGGTRSDVFNRIKADVLGLPYRPLAEADTAVYASAMIAAYGAGMIPDLQARMKVRTRAECYLPSEENHREYEKRAGVYRKLADMMGELGRKMDDERKSVYAQKVSAKEGEKL